MNTATSADNGTYYTLDGSVHAIDPDQLEQWLSAPGATDAEWQEFEESPAGECARVDLVETERENQSARELMAELSHSMAELESRLAPERGVAITRGVGGRLAAPRRTRHRRASGSRPVRTRGSRRGTASRGDPDDLADYPPAYKPAPGRRR